MSKGKPEKVKLPFEITDMRIPKLIYLQPFISSANYLLITLVQIFEECCYFYYVSYIILFSCLVQMYKTSIFPLH